MVKRRVFPFLPQEFLRFSGAEMIRAHRPADYLSRSRDPDPFCDAFPHFFMMCAIMPIPP